MLQRRQYTGLTDLKQCLFCINVVRRQVVKTVNPLIRTLKPKSSVPLYSNTVIGNWPLVCGLLHLVQRGGDWAGPQAAPRSTKCNSALRQS